MRFASSRKQRSHRFSAGTCSTICGSPNSLCVHIRSPSAQKASEGTAAAISGVSRTKKKRSGFLDIAIDALDAQFRCDRWGKEEIKIVAARPVVIAPVGVMQPQSDYALFARRALVALLKMSLPDTEGDQVPGYFKRAQLVGRDHEAGKRPLNGQILLVPDPKLVARDAE